MILEIRKICCYKLILEQKDIFLQFESLRETGAREVKIFVIIWNATRVLIVERNWTCLELILNQSSLTDEIKYKTLSDCDW